jgi:AraC-like DNA-binding protein
MTTMIVDPHVERVGLPVELGTYIARQALHEGPSRCTNWPGLTFYRFEERVGLHWSEVGSASLCMVVQGRKRLRIGSSNYFYDPLHYLVIKRGLSFQAEILQASRERPFLSFVLQMQPDLVAGVYNEMIHQAPDGQRIEPAPALPDVYVSALDLPLVGAVQRFLQALEAEPDRTVLAPMYQREIVYRLLRSEQHVWLLESATREKQGNTITAAIAFMQQEIQRPLTVRGLAEAVSMSESRFAHLFKATTDVSPLQFLKHMRLEHARKFLLSGASVGEAAESVGYTSQSHFISEFKRYFGESPRAYTLKLRSLHGASLKDVSSI